ncbi:hypothetical protein [Streptomyces spiralis]|uniref:hypothetical protein n=1 Tax=Streptomyces spiralis TaxID=66376 RepID=UPI0036A85906
MSQQQYPQHQSDPQQGGLRPEQPKKQSKGKVAGLGCLGIVVLAAVIAAVSGGGGDSDSSAGSRTSNSVSKGDGSGDKGGAGEAKGGASDKKVAVFKVWGTATNGVDINYGSDSDSRKGTFVNGEFEASLPVTKGVMYFNVMGQLQGGGDIQCSVTIGGKTKKGHASGDYNICDAQLNSDLFGGWD